MVAVLSNSQQSPQRTLEEDREQVYNAGGFTGNHFPVIDPKEKGGDTFIVLAYLSNMLH